MKKLAIYLVLAVSLGLAACSGDDDSATPQNNPSGDTTAIGTAEAPNWKLTEIGEEVSENPHWKVNMDSMDISSSMTMTISISNTSLSMVDSVAAFIDDTVCVGVSPLMYVSTFCYPLFINRPLNHTSSNITLRYYSAVLGKVFTFVKNVPSFVNDAIQGSYDSPLVFSMTSAGAPISTAYAVVKMPENIRLNYSTDDEIAFINSRGCVAIRDNGVVCSVGYSVMYLLGTISMYEETENIQVKYYSAKLKTIFISDTFPLKTDATLSGVVAPNFTAQQ